MPGTRFAYGLSALAAAALLASFATGCKPRAVMHQPLAAAQVRARLERRLAHAPLAFEPNLGQSADATKYLAHGEGYMLALDETGAKLRLERGAAPTLKAPSASKPLTSSDPSSEVSIQFVGAQPHARIEGVDRQRGIVNYLIGRDSSKWHRRIPTYARVRYRSIYPGIDLVYHGTQGRLEYDLVVAPDADPHRIRFAIEGGARPELNRAGDLVIGDRESRVTLRKPVIYQETLAGRRTIDGGFRMIDKSTVGFEVAAYDHRRPLVIDPTVLTYSSYLGGLSAYGRGIAVDASGGVYVTGWTDLKDDLPTRSLNLTGPHQAHLNPGSTNGFAINAFVAKFDTTMSGDSSLVYSTYLGGTGIDEAFGIAVDGSGDAYVTGFTASTDFPQQNSSVQVSGYARGPSDAFVTELLPDGSGLVYSTYLGGEGFEIGEGIAVDPSGSAYVAGQTYSLHFPTTGNALQQSDPVASETPEGFLTKLTPASAGSITLAYSTYLAAVNNPPTQISGANIASVAADSAGIAYVAGEADPNFLSGLPGAPTNYAGAEDAIIAAIDTTKSGVNSLVYATYLGGSASDGASGIALQPGCSSPCAAYVTGSTISADFPVTTGAAITTFNNTAEDFAAEIQPSGKPLWVTFLGGSLIANAQAIAVDTAGRPFIAGATWSPDFPVLNQIQPFGGLSGQLLQSADDGATVTQLNWPGSMAGSVTVGALALDTSPSPANPSVVYAGTINNGVWVSTDGGTTPFTQITNASFPDLPTTGCWGLAYTNLTTPPMLYAGCNNGLYLITNNGANVVKAAAKNFLSTPMIHSLTTGGASAPNTLYIGTNEGFYVSPDSGATFNRATGLPKPTQVWCSVVDQQGNLLIGTNRGLFISTDGGASFAATHLNYVQVNAIAADTVSGIVYAGTGNGVVASNDEFNVNFTFGLGLAIFPSVNGLAIDYSTTRPSVFAAVDDFTNRAGWIVKSTDQGQTFNLVFGNNIFPGFTDALVIDPTTASPTIYAGVAEDADATVTGLSADGTQILFSTFLGGPSFDYGEGIALDANDDAFVTGETYFGAFPFTPNAFEQTPVSSRRPSAMHS